MTPLSASQSTVCGLAWKRYSRQTPLRDVVPTLNGRASLAGVRPCRTGAASSWWQEHGAAHAGGPRAQQAGKLETRALFAGSQGGTGGPAGGNTFAPLSAHVGSIGFSEALRPRGHVVLSRGIQNDSGLPQGPAGASGAS